MKKYYFPFILFLIFLSGCASQKKDLTSIHHLDEAANFLMLVSDGEVGVTNTCQLKALDALNMLQPLHALIDDEIKKDSDIVDENQLMKCETNCHCGIYSDLSTNENRKRILLEEARNITHKKLIECANQSAKWLCQSSLLKKLKSEIEPNNNAL